MELFSPLPRQRTHRAAKGFAFFAASETQFQTDARWFLCVSAFARRWEDKGTVWDEASIWTREAGGRAETQRFCSPLCVCLGAFCVKRWFNLIIFLWILNAAVHSQKAPRSDEPADITRVYFNCVNAFALPARSSCSVHFTVNGLTWSWRNTKERPLLTPRAVRLLFTKPGVAFARGGGDGTSLAVLQVGACNFLAPRVKAAPWRPSSAAFQDSSTCKYPRYEDYSWEHFSPEYQLFSNTRAFLRGITQEDSNTNSWEQSHPTASRRSDSPHRLEKYLKEEGKEMKSWLTLTPCGQWADEDEGRGGTSSCCGLGHGHRHAAALAAQPRARLRAWAQPAAPSKRRLSSGIWWYLECSASPSCCSRHVLDASVYPEWLRAEASLSQQPEPDYSRCWRCGLVLSCHMKCNQGLTVSGDLRKQTDCDDSFELKNTHPLASIYI